MSYLIAAYVIVLGSLGLYSLRLHQRLRHAAGQEPVSPPQPPPDGSAGA